jgi:PAS domain-containing protein
LIPLAIFAIYNGKDDDLNIPPTQASSLDKALYTIDSIGCMIESSTIDAVSRFNLEHTLLNHKSHIHDSANPLQLLTVGHMTNEDMHASLHTILNQYMMYMYDRLLHAHRNDARLRLSMAVYLCRRMRYQNQAMQVIHQTSRSECSSRYLYLIDKTQAIIECMISKNISDMPADTSKSILANARVEQVFMDIVQLSGKMQKFWKNVAALKSDLNITKRLSYEIVNEIEKLRSEMKKPLYQSFPPLLLAYYRFEKYVLNNNLMNDKVMKVIMNKTKLLFDSTYSFDNVLPDTDLTQTDQGYAVLDCHDEKRFEIINCNKSFARLLNYQKDELTGTDFMVHIPKQMQHAARDILNLKDGIKDQVFVLQMRHGYIREFMLSAKHTADEYDRDIVVVRLSQKAQSYSSYLFLADKSGVIVAYSTSMICVTQAASTS